MNDLKNYQGEVHLKPNDIGHYLAVLGWMLDTPPPWNMTVDHVRVACGMTKAAQAARFVERALAVGILTGKIGNLSAPMALENWKYWDEQSKRQSENASGRARDTADGSLHDGCLDVQPTRSDGGVFAKRNHRKGMLFQRKWGATAGRRSATPTKYKNKTSLSSFEQSLEERENLRRQEAEQYLEATKGREPSAPSTALRQSKLAN